jgi:hypothetical protein
MAAIVVGIMSGFSFFFPAQVKAFQLLSNLEGRFSRPYFLAPHRTAGRMANFAWIALRQSRRRLRLQVLELTKALGALTLK